MNDFILFTKKKVTKFLSIRKGEIKIGEKIQLISNTLEDTKGKFVLIGIPEDIGPRANHGNSGAKNSWKAFLNKFLNMQVNSFINPEEIILAGEVNTEDLSPEDVDVDVESLRYAVSILDKRVEKIIQKIIACNKIPIVIGGGHNNCFPIINSFPKPIQVLNIDPHADLRELEGRHSGNGFTNALNTRKLDKYFVLGLHEEYNSSYILGKFNTKDNLSFYSFNNFLKHDLSITELSKKVLPFLDSAKIGFEIDLDSIKNMPVSARTPLGFTEEEMRKLFYQISENYDFHYLHICEGAPSNKKEKLTVGKTIAYLVSDFIKYNS